MSGTVTNTLWMLIIGAGKLIMIRLIIFIKESEFTRHQTRPLLMRDLISVNLAPLLRIVRRYFRLIFIMNRRYFFCLRDYIYSLERVVLDEATSIYTRSCFEQSICLNY